jgi:hypothetical protein
MKKIEINKHKLNSPFATPEGYFEDFSDKLQKRIEGSYEPEKISKKLPFGVPEKYFELLPQRIAGRIAQQKKQIWYKEPAWQWAIAACSVVLLVWIGQNVWWEVYKNPLEKAEATLITQLKKIDKEEIEQYLVANHRKVVALDEVQQSSIEPNNEVKKKQKNNDTLFQDLPKEVLEEVIPESIFQEVLEENWGDESKESTFLEIDTLN